MAEYCLDCMNKMDGTNYKKWDVVLETDLCEGCGEVKPCVIGFRSGIKKYIIVVAGVSVIAIAVELLIRLVG